MITLMNRTQKFHELLFVDGKRMPIHSDLIKHMLTLQNMTGDYASEAGTPIPVPAFITEPIMKWIIDAYILYEAKGFGLDSFDNLYDNIAIYNNLNALTRPDASPSYLTLFGDGGEPIRDDLPIMASLIEALNWLDAKQLLFITLDKLFEIVGGMTSRQIRDAYTPDMVVVEEDSNATKLPYTPYYEREKLMYDFLTQMILKELVPVIAPVIQRYVNPIQCGIHHQLFLKADGLYGSGSNILNQLGLEKEEIHPLTKLTTLPGKPLLIACGSSSSYCLTTSGLYHTGSDVLEPGSSTISKWTLLEVDGEVLLIESCHARIMVLTTRGLFAMGKNEFGELGVGDELPRTRLTRVAVDGKVLAISCGDRHTIILTTSGFYGTGANDRHQLSSVIKGTAVNTFHRILAKIIDIKSIAAGSAHTILVAFTGLFGVGRSENGQLGLGVTFADRYTMFRIPTTDIEGDLISVYANDGYTLLLTSTALYSTGLSKTGSTVVFVKVFDTTDEGICSVTCSQQQVFLFTDKGNVFLAGRTRGLPTVEVSMEDESDIVLKVFTKMAIEMGYTSTCLEDDKQLTKLQCEHCSGDAKFIDSYESPLCSVYCLYKHNLQQ